MQALIHFCKAPLVKIMKEPAVPDEVIISKIYLVRGQKVMLDKDLAILYGVETKSLNLSVKRNIKRFPEDFMFRLTQEEWSTLRFQFETSNSRKESLTLQNETLKPGRGGTRYSPYAFTEQGVAMLSSILNSNTAIEVNIRIIRIFTRMREMLLTHKDILLKLEQLERQVVQNSEEIQTIFAALKELLQPPPREPIGFKTGGSAV